jgi:ubiquinone/menaquinone biosynthesis C-methylase UbiE
MQSPHISSFVRFLLVILLVLVCSSSSDKLNHPLLSFSNANAEENNLSNNESQQQNPPSSQNPPIDCPLRKQGINPHDLKPFADTQKHIDFLERSDRASWQKPDAVVQELHLSGAEKIADVGAGSGYFTFRFAQALPEGKVYAIDIEPEMLRHIHHKAISEGVKNIEIIKATPDDPKISADVDLVFACDVIHHVKDSELWLRKLSAQMKKRARLVVIEFKEGNLPEGPPAAVKIPKKKLIDMILEHNFKLDRDKADFLPYQEFIIFSKL